MNNNSIIFKLYERPETVFSLHEISQLFPDIAYESMRDRLYYFTKIGKLKRPSHGIYAKADFNALELVNKLYKPSYISLETVLAKESVVFQYYETIFAVSYLTRSVAVNEINIQYRQLKGDVLTNTTGIEYKDGYYIASRERAFLDAIYIYKNYHFDNLGTIDWQIVDSLKKIYNNKNFEKKVEDYYRDYKEDYGIK